MKHLDKRLTLVAGIFLLIIYLVGIAGISISSLRSDFVDLTPYTLLLSAVILFAFHRRWNLRFIAAIVVIALAGFWVEVLGVKTGVIFGGYSYGPVLGIKWKQVPLIIALNWLILIYCSYIIAGKLLRSALPRLALTAALMVGMDVIMEPVAITLDMWTWEAVAPPLQNYAAWFGISFLFAGLLHYLKIEVVNPLAGYLFFYLVMFFGILNLTV